MTIPAIAPPDIDEVSTALFAVPAVWVAVLLVPVVEVVATAPDRQDMSSPSTTRNKLELAAVPGLVVNRPAK